MKKLKIGLFIDNFFPVIDGVVMVVDNYARRMSVDHEVVVVCPSYGKRDKECNLPYKVIRVQSIKIPRTEFTLALPQTELRLFKELEEESFDIIHIHSPFTMGKLGVDIAKILDIPVIGTMHSQMKFEFMKYTKSERITDILTLNAMKVYDQCTECWAVNKRIGEVFIEYGYNGIPKVQENGTDMTLVEDETKSNLKINKLYKLKKDDNVLLFVGRINVVKNILFIIDVLKELDNRGVFFKMLFVGSGPDEKVLKKAIEENNLGKRVTMCGQVKDRELLKSIFLRAKLFVFPSLFDASSLVQIEAASQKTPTIFIENSATSNTITPEVNGFVAENDVVLFANKVEYILKNKDYYETIKENCHREIYKKWDDIVVDVLKRYEDIISEYE